MFRCLFFFKKFNLIFFIFNIVNDILNGNYREKVVNATGVRDQSLLDRPDVHFHCFQIYFCNIDLLFFIVE